MAFQYLDHIISCVYRCSYTIFIFNFIMTEANLWAGQPSHSQRNRWMLVYTIVSIMLTLITVSRLLVYMAIALLELTDRYQKPMRNDIECFYSIQVRRKLVCVTVTCDGELLLLYIGLIRKYFLQIRNNNQTMLEKTFCWYMCLSPAKTYWKRAGEHSSTDSDIPEFVSNHSDSEDGRLKQKVLGWNL